MRSVISPYYPWWGGINNGWRHWNSSGHVPPNDVAAACYPTLNPYDSGDGNAILMHLGWAGAANVDVLAVSWWGQGGYEDARLPLLFQTAEAYNAYPDNRPVKLAFILEPYANRTGQNLVDDIRYLLDRFGTSPALFRLSRPTLYGPTAIERPLMLVYDPVIDGTWAGLIDGLRGTAYDSLILGRMDDSMLYDDSQVRTALSWARMDGLWNFGCYEYPTPMPTSPDYLLMPGIAPGWDDRRDGRSDYSSRENGARYDRVWSQVLAWPDRPELVNVISFNEWHEGSQIEPAKPFSYRKNGKTIRYADYEGHYGLIGQAAQSAYLSRTALHAASYRAG